MKEGKTCIPTKEELKHTLEKLRALTDGIDEPIYVADPNTYEVLFTNKKTRELFGEKIIGKQCYRVFQSLNLPCPFCTNKHLFRDNTGKTYTRELQNQRNKHWYKCIDKAIKWPGGKHVRYGIAIDITEQKKTEEELRKSEGRYRKLIENAPIAIYTISAENGTITSLNPAFEKITGWSREEWLGKPFIPLIHPDDLPLAMETFQRVLRGESLLPYELRVLSKSGEYLVGEFTSMPVIENGKAVGEFGIVRDITESKRAGQALQESEERFRFVVENSHDAILIIDDNFRIVYANNEAVRLSGYAKEEITGQDFGKFLDEETKFLVQDRYLRRQKGEKVPIQYELKIVRKDGDKRDVEIKSTAIRERSGKTRTIAQLLDITENKKMEEERKLFEDKLSALNIYGQNLNMARNMDEVYKLTLDAMARILGFEFSDIFIIEGNVLCLKDHRGYSPVLSLDLPLDKDKGITVRAARTGKPVLVSDVRKDKAYVKGGEGILSELAVPIKIGDRVIGVLNVESKKLGAFDENNEKLLEILASHAAIAVTNLKRQEGLSALNEYAQNLNMTKDIEEIYKLTLDAMEKTLGFEYAAFLMIKGKMLSLMAQRKYPKKLEINLQLDGDKGVTVKAAKTGKPVLIPDVRKEKTYVGAGVKGMLSELAVPVKAGKRVLGVLNVESKRLAAFDEEDKKLLEILASHAATAISNLKRQETLRVISKKIENLMKSSTKIMQVKEMHKRLKVITKAIQNFGWRRVVISLRDENLEGTDLVAAGLTKDEVKLLLERKAPGHVWRERLGTKFERLKIGEFYYLPWSDPWIRENVHGVPPGTSFEEATTYAGVPSRLSIEEMVDWHPQDMLYAPLCTPEGRIVGILSMDDPLDGRRPTRESLIPLELFLHQAAITIENAQLIESLRETRKQLEIYAEQLEQKVEERTCELKKSQEQLLKAQRLAVIGELAGMVGHDLRNPLTSIAGAEYYLKKRLSIEANDKIKEMLGLIEKNITYSNKIINDLLDYSREIGLELMEKTPKSIVREALSLMEIPKKVRIIDLTENKPKIMIDVEKIKRAFVNIIRNAVEAMPKGGTLTIKGRGIGDRLEIVFSDTGVGMSKETLEKLWTPLFTTKAKGMGFGLSICKRFIEAHYGTINVKSTLRKGTVVTVTFPIEPKMEKGGEKVWVKPPESSLLMMTKT